MHAILFQMALIPLTMSRFSIASLNESFVHRLIPLNRALRMHIHLGYTMISIVFLATIFFFAFFGMLCTDGEEQFCKKFTSEIMITVSKSGFLVESLATTKVDDPLLTYDCWLHEPSATGIRNLGFIACDWRDKLLSPSDSL